MSQTLALEFDVNTDQIIEANKNSNEWLTHGRTYSEQRYSSLNQINSDNIKNLNIEWFYDLDSSRGHEATPLVIDGIMFTTGAWSVVYANNAVTGELLWKYDPKVPREKAYYLCCDAVNRGVAAWQGKVFVGTLDGRLIALDAKDGSVVWETMTVDSFEAYSITGAPRVIKGKVIIGNGGAEFGVRGYVSAYDVNNGNMLWRFFTVPGNPENGFENAAMEMAAETWKGSEWWKFGGGGTVWDSMAYDPDLDILYIGTGNGSPWNYKVRSPGGGDNLFLSSIVALKPDTGDYVWHYQTTPGDNWDYTATQHIILADLEIDGKIRKVLMQAPKNGFFYVLDRTNGELLSAENYVKVTWASGIDKETGRPIKTNLGNYEKNAVLLFPGALGGHNWMPMSFNPDTGLVYIPAQELYMPFKKDENYNYDKKGWNTAVDFTVITPPKNLLQLSLLVRSVRGRLSAWDPVEQKEVWKQYLTLPWNGGILSTSGNLVFQGTSDGELVAYDASTGEQKWSKNLQTGIVAAPITYSINGKQYVTVVAGYGGVFALQAGLPPKYSGGPINARIVTFSLDGDIQLPQRPANINMPKPPPPNEDQASIARGEVLYHLECHVCHGAGAMGGGVISDLRYMTKETHEKFEAITLGGLYIEKGMVGFARRLNEQNAEDIHAYLIQRANETYFLETLNSVFK
ncbi:MAG TPA: PQQ-dependent dehydrogenase, methanol/ethanol family [Gammaproteobacteria bacterium]|nr:PQQ-dependent dehydrogenase, methanol/ethanol family [Gammaproteobacteria bacterium]HIK76964.1 PQQ-dependent dehydrogenase, methanol/ethanol family [Gammaproteobacteria bacterium]